MELFQFLRHISDNPIYQREKGRWGDPNPFFVTINRYSPFVLIGAIILGLCSGGGAISSLGFAEDMIVLVVLWIFLCLPNFVMQALIWTGIILIPVLTAPIISYELSRGSWDILRLIPYPTWQILLAKMLGGLARLKIWWPMLIFSLLQAGGVVIGLWASANLSGEPLWVFVSVLVVGVTTITRPWFEVLFIALVGVTSSLFIRSARIALLLTYMVVLAVRFFNGSILWSILSAPFHSTMAMSGGFLLVFLGPLLVYIFLCLVTAVAISWGAQRLEAGKELHF